jgi:hypothetical protein
MATPSSELLPSTLPLNASFYQQVTDGYIDPSVLSNPVRRLNSTMDMDEFVEGQFPNEQPWSWGSDTM